jgi:hypothetical protein
MLAQTSLPDVARIPPGQLYKAKLVTIAEKQSQCAAACIRELGRAPSSCVGPSATTREIHPGLAGPAPLEPVDVPPDKTRAGQNDTHCTWQRSITSDVNANGHRAKPCTEKRAAHCRTSRPQCVRGQRRGEVRVRVVLRQPAELEQTKNLLSHPVSKN